MDIFAAVILFFMAFVFLYALIKAFIDNEKVSTIAFCLLFLLATANGAFCCFICWLAV